MSDRELPTPEDGFRLISFPEKMGAMVLASEACARAFSSTPRQFAAFVRGHVEKFGEAYARELPPGANVVKLTYARAELLLMFALLDLGDGRSPVAVIAAGLPSEQLALEKSIGALRRHMKKLAKGGAFLPQ